MKNQYVPIHSLPSDLHESRNIWENNYNKAEFVGANDNFKDEYNSLNYNYRGRHVSEKEDHCENHQVKNLESQIKELKDILFNEINKKDDIISQIAKENQELKNKLGNAKSKEKIKIPLNNKTVKNKTQNAEKNFADVNSYKIKIQQLQDQISNLSHEIYLNNTISRNDDEYIISQIEKWKNKAEYLTKLYPNTVADLKRQIFTQNMDFQTSINNTKESNNEIIDNLELAYQSLLGNTEFEKEELFREKEYLEQKTLEIKKALKINK
jgi:hypothetical protein